MAAQKGRDLLLKVDSTGAGVYVTVAGLRTRKLAFSAEAADVTDTDSAGRWRELLAGTGVRRASLSGAGVFRDAQADATVRTLFFGGVQRNWQVVIPDFGTVSGPFHISALEYGGEHDGEVTFEMALESAGELTFTAL
ncbi:phage major tail protein, TP901-1 family [Pseudoxanthobacter sp.]|uniref:phage major tail protein, TP901-1 family n=1 Tax=Pseudoxanthobacter sp. TaxID=1925742 RepID=UPI002FE06478